MRRPEGRRRSQRNDVHEEDPDHGGREKRGRTRTTHAQARVSLETTPDVHRCDACVFHSPERRKEADLLWVAERPPLRERDELVWWQPFSGHEDR
jgi:hypothetical protein